MERRLLRRGVRERSLAPPAGEAWEVVRSLPPRQRAVVVLRYVADLSQSEIAEVLGVTRSTVSTTLTAAPRALAPMLDDQQADDLSWRHSGRWPGTRSTWPHFARRPPTRCRPGCGRA